MPVPFCVFELFNDKEAFLIERRFLLKLQAATDSETMVSLFTLRGARLCQA